MRIKIISIIAAFITLSCANEKTISGGEKDTKPPKLQFTDPPNESVLVNPTTLYMEFDELIELNNIKSNLFITPDMDNSFKTRIKGKKMWITFDKPFEENTTYTLYFNNSIRDVTERNESKNITYVFSTGEYLDSLSLDITVKYPLTNKPCDNCLVGIYYVKDTMDITNHRPIYFGFTEKNGKASINNIKAGAYKIFALKDDNKNFMLDKNEAVSFLTDTILLDSSNRNVDMFLIRNEKKKQKKNEIIQYDDTYKIELAKGFKKLSILDTAQNEKNIKYWLSNYNEIHIVNTERERFFNLVTKDSLNQVDTVNIEVRNDTSKTYFIELTSKQRYIKPTENIEISLSNIPKLIIDSLVYFVEDSVIIPNTGWKIDSAANKLIIFPPKDLINFKLEIDSAAIQTSTIVSKKFTTPLTILEETDTGILSGKVICSQNTILQLIDNKFRVIEEILNPTDWTFTYLRPNSYQLRLIIDSNENGYWDDGNFKKQIQPEKVIFHKDIITVKNNWEIQELNMNCSDINDEN